MSFEIRHRDMLGRIGRILTKSGKIDTPIFLPVINPAIQLILPKTLSEEFGCRALITNAYILRNQQEDGAKKKGVHQLLDFDGVVMTDSGAYQILTYGEVDVDPAEIIKFQELISTDIATILDIPTRYNARKDDAKRTVDETINRAEQLSKMKTRSDILWVGPIQGGHYLDLVAYSSKKISELPFQIHALGSPTQIMEQYLFDILVDMILTAKINTSSHTPFHLFGAGHPFMFSLAVALGCDLFDSAAYAIYAREDRYMTPFGTNRLGELEYFPCSCPICRKYDPTDLRSMPFQDKQRLLAEHNLHTCFEEVKRVKQRIVEGRLWEYLEARAHVHPSLLKAVKKLKKYENYIERHSTVSKRKGLFFFSSLGLARPEIVHYRKMLRERYSSPVEAKILLLLPQPNRKPFHLDKVIRKLLNLIADSHEKNQLIQVCVYAAPFGVVPLELDEVYPLSQHEIATPLDLETIEYVAEQVRNFIKSSSFNKVFIVEDTNVWRGIVTSVCRNIKRKSLSITFLRVEEKSSEEVANYIAKTLEAAIQDCQKDPVNAVNDITVRQK